MATLSFYAHRPDCDQSTKKWESIDEHLELLRRKIKKAVKDINLPWLNEELPRLLLITMLHDIGKLKDAFQEKLATGFEKEQFAAAHTPIAVRLLCDDYGLQDGITEYIIAGHHAGLCNGNEGIYDTIYNSLDSKFDDTGLLIHRAIKHLDPKTGFTDWFQNISNGKYNSFPTYSKLDREFITRFLFATFTTADHAATRQYMKTANWEAKNPGQKNKTPLVRRVNKLSWGQFNYLKRSIRRLHRHANASKDGDSKGVLAQRKEWYSEALKAARSVKSDVYSLDLPTGGGKTLIGLSFCYSHALRNNKKRIIYVAPYLNIIDQTAQVFAKHLGIRRKAYGYLCEHHSNGTMLEKIDKYFERMEYKHENIDSYKFDRMLDEQWRHPIVVTTMVQFVESLFNNRVARLQKMKNLANSVIFFDEFQLLPVDIRKDVTQMIDQLVKHCNCSVVYGSATNSPWHEKYGTSTVKSIIQCDKTPKDFRRVKVEWHKTWEIAQLLERVNNERQAFCVVNKRATVQIIAQVSGHEFVRCLTTLQNKKHRLQVLAECRQRLKDKLPVLLISTQSIEAGVDIDFPVGYRQLAPLDSIIQAAGRVNRGGKLKKKGILNLFDLPIEYSLKSLHYKIGIDVVKQMLGNKGSLDIYDARNLATHFDKFDTTYKDSRQPKQKNKNDGRKLTIDEARKRQLYHYIANHMKVIDEETVNIIVPANVEEVKKVNELMLAVKNENASFSSRENHKRQLQLYSVTLFRRQLEELKKAYPGRFLLDCEEIIGTEVFIPPAGIYDPLRGLILATESGDEIEPKSFFVGDHK